NPVNVSPYFNSRPAENRLSLQLTFLESQGKIWHRPTCRHRKRLTCSRAGRMQKKTNVFAGRLERGGTNFGKTTSRSRLPWSKPWRESAPARGLLVWKQPFRRGRSCLRRSNNSTTALLDSRQQLKNRSLSEYRLSAPARIHEAPVPQIAVSKGPR